MHTHTHTHTHTLLTLRDINTQAHAQQVDHYLSVSPPDRHGPFGAKLKALQKEAAEADQTNQAEGAASVENTLSFNNSGVELVTFQTLDPDDDGPDTQSRRPTKDDKHRQSTKDNKHRQSTKDDKHRQSTKDDKHRQSTKDDKHRQSTKDDKHRQSTKEVKQSPM